MRFPGQARAEDKEWLDKEGLCAGCCRAGTEGEGEEEPSRGRGQRDQALEGLGSSLCVLAVLGKTPLRLAKSQHKSPGPIFEGHPPEGIYQGSGGGRCHRGKEGFNFSLLSGEPTQYDGRWLVGSGKG